MSPTNPLAAHQLRVRGQVQGVGFRPHVYRLAQSHGIAGWVRNDGRGVSIHVQGSPAAVAAFQQDLLETPSLARVEAVEVQTAAVDPGLSGFRIEASGTGPVATQLPPDTAVCADCLAELFDPEDRRYRYALINCTRCGPRYTITARLPYDRRHTTMALYRQCSACAAEYRNPGHRRFHAEPNACPACGPALQLTDAAGQDGGGVDLLAAAVAYLGQGQILAVKGLGGFHLACDARNEQAVARLRAGKGRPHKPLAIMVLNPESLSRWAHVEAERTYLASPERPICLLPKCPAADRDLPGVAPEVPWLGAMLPATPLQYLLFHEAAGRPAGTDWLTAFHPLVLVMTSANRSGDPLIIDESTARDELADVADAFLFHGRAITGRCDDSVLRGGDMVRRARGYVPAPVRLPAAGRSVLALGAGLKNTLCLTRDHAAYLSPHIGDLNSAAACRALEATAVHLRRLLDIEPTMIVHDAHPDLYSSRLADRWAREQGLPSLAVQHHHAHIAAVAAEHGLDAAVLGLALDGIGLGEDGSLRGGELLWVHGGDYRHVGQLRPLPLPGGDRAAQAPWRMAAAVLHELDCGAAITERFPGPDGEAVAALLAQGRSPGTSSAGRLFDAAAGLLGYPGELTFEGQAAAWLEGQARAHGAVAPWRGGFECRDGQLDCLPLLARLAETQEPAYGAALFHATLAWGLASWVQDTAAEQGLAQVALGGGCWVNGLLSQAVQTQLRAAGLRVLTAHQVPPNDGAISLGQAWVAVAKLREEAPCV